MTHPTKSLRWRSTIDTPQNHSLRSRFRGDPENDPRGPR
jgi:hypothetical protein